MLFRILFVLNLFITKAFAQSALYSNSDEIQSALNQNMYEPNYISLLLGLFLVIILIYITGFVYQKLVKVKLNTSSNASNKIEIISTTSLGQGKNLHIIKVNGVYSLIGATVHGISHLKDYTQSDIDNFLREYDNENC